MQFKPEENTITLDTWPLSKSITNLIDAQRKLLDQPEGTVNNLQVLRDMKAALVDVAQSGYRLYREIDVLENFLETNRVKTPN